MDKCYLRIIEKILHLLYTTNINYFSLNVFENQQPVINYCNNQNWYNYCINNYGVLMPASMQKYIFSSKLNIINWNLLTCEQQTKEYIQRRNNIAEIKYSISFSYNIQTKLIVLTLGSHLNDKCLVDFLRYKFSYLYLLSKNYLLSA